MPQVPGTKVPESLYLVTREPASLAGMEYPRWEGLSWSLLGGLGLEHVVCLADEVCACDPSPLRVPTGIRLQDLAEGDQSEDLSLEERKVRQAALDVLAWVRRGEGAAVHCAGGTGRTGTVLGCVLRGLGYTSNDVLAYLDWVTRARGHEKWPESDWQATMVGRFLP